MSNARVAKAMRAAADDSTGKALVRQQILAAEIIENTLDLRCIAVFINVARKLARDLGAAVLTPGKQRDGAA